MGWDQTVMMPPGGGAARGAHAGDARPRPARELTRPPRGKLLDERAPYDESLEYDSDEAR